MCYSSIIFSVLLAGTVITYLVVVHTFTPNPEWTTRLL